MESRLNGLVSCNMIKKTQKRAFVDFIVGDEDLTPLRNFHFASQKTILILSLQILV